jgi:hypothetical protein
MKLLISLCLVMFFALGRLVAQQAGTPSVAQANPAELWQVVTINKISLEGTLKEGTEFEINIEARKPKVLQGDYFGSAGQPGSVIAEITVKLGGEKMSFPKQAFNDLANPLFQTVSLTSQPSGEVRLRFTGGDGSTTYEAQYFIQSNRLAKRSISYFEASAGGKKREVVKTTTF